MPEGPDGRAIIIVKKVVGHGGHHGGSWKVAYADFVTSMMCLFLVLWLVNTASVVTREKIASYFKRPGVFEEGSGAPLQVGGIGFMSQPETDPKEDVETSEHTYDITSRKKDGGDDETKAKGYNKAKHEVLKSVAKDIREKLESRSRGAMDGKYNIKKNSDEKDANGFGVMGVDDLVINSGNTSTEQNKATKSVDSGQAADGSVLRVEMTMDDYGLNLEIMDTTKGSMFTSGSSRISLQAEKKIREIGQILAKIPNKLDIEGHTDGLAFLGNKAQEYDNWDLSTDRANEARRVLLNGGLGIHQITRVAGFADTRLKVATNPSDPSNRRISIKVRYTEEAEAIIKKDLNVDYSVGGIKNSSSQEVVDPAVNKTDSASLSNARTDARAKSESSKSQAINVELNLSNKEKEDAHISFNKSHEVTSGRGNTAERKYLIFGYKDEFLR